MRHKLLLLCIISLNGGWTADSERNKPGRDLGYDKMAEALSWRPFSLRNTSESSRPGNHQGSRARLASGKPAALQASRPPRYQYTL